MCVFTTISSCKKLLNPLPFPLAAFKRGERKPPIPNDQKVSALQSLPTSNSALYECCISHKSFWQKRELTNYSRTKNPRFYHEDRTKWTSPSKKRDSNVLLPFPTKNSHTPILFCRYFINICEHRLNILLTASRATKHRSFSTKVRFFTPATLIFSYSNVVSEKKRKIKERKRVLQVGTF